MWNAKLDEAQAGIKIAGSNINHLIYADDTIIMAESEEDLKSLLMKVKGSEQTGLKLYIQKKLKKIKIKNKTLHSKNQDHGSGPITSWQIDGETMETVTDFTFLGSKITADGNCSHEIKRRLLLGRKTMTNLDSILKSRDITLLTKVCIVKAMIFSSSRVWMWELDHKKGWVPKNWCFWTVVLEKTLGSPLDCKEIQPVHPKGDQSWILLEGLMLKLKLQYFGHLMWSTDSLGKTLMLGKIEGRRRRRQQRMRWLDGIPDSVDRSLNKLLGYGEGQGSLVCCSPWDRRVGRDWMTEQQQNASIHSPPHPPFTKKQYTVEIPFSPILSHHPSIHHHWLSNTVPSVSNNCLSIYGWFIRSPHIWFSVTNLPPLPLSCFSRVWPCATP